LCLSQLAGDAGGESQQHRTASIPDALCLTQLTGDAAEESQKHQKGRDSVRCRPTKVQVAKIRLANTCLDSNLNKTQSI